MPRTGQQLLISKSTRSPGLITVNGVPVIALLNQLPGSSVRLMVSAVPPEAWAACGATADNASSASEVRQVENDKVIFFMVR